MGINLLLILCSEDWPYTDILGTTTEECNAQQKVDSGEVPAAYLNCEFSELGIEQVRVYLLFIHADSFHPLLSTSCSADPKVVNSVNDRSSFEERRDRLMAAGEWYI